ncbi:MAG: beta-L-arabinofuranosidase domain-containing protein [Bacillota bacterium]
MLKERATQFIQKVKLTGGLLAERADVVRSEVLPYQWRALNDQIPGAEPSHAIENLRIAAGEAKGEFHGMLWQDSDVAKWLEAVAYSLMTYPDPELEARADEVIDLVGRAQQSDGYLNSYFTVVAPDRRWTNLRDNHELYCAGHFIEAAVAYYQATGKDELLKIMCRFVDHIASVFGPGENQKRGYPGHEEIELALIKLYRVTRDRRHLDLAKFFIEERGRQPHYFDLEAEARGEKPSKRLGDYWYHQAHMPVREQTTAVGHAVRAMYLYTAVADLALETEDAELLQVCERIWDNVVNRRMYITAGIGSEARWEGFTIDYDLPSDTAYAETCASIGLVFWAQRMLQITPDRKYADVMERALYNGVLSGMSLEGTKFFYVNPLSVDPEICKGRYDHHHVKPTRQGWFGCACCPPNIARLLASIGQYIYSQGKDGLYMHLFAASEATFAIGGSRVKLVQQTDYPWDGTVRIKLEMDAPLGFGLNIRIPGWCDDPKLVVCGESIVVTVPQDGYVRIHRTWTSGDEVVLELPMPVTKVWASTRVSDNVGKVALQRGPVVYCVEEADNGPNLAELWLPADAELRVEMDPVLKVPAIVGQGVRRVSSSDALYTTERPVDKPCTIRAIPYFMWDNRGLGEMRVWINDLTK